MRGEKSRKEGVNMKALECRVDKRIQQNRNGSNEHRITN